MVPTSRQINNIYEINTLTYLDRLSKKAGERITLASIPEEELARIAIYGCDVVWLMGVWERSPLAREMAQSDAPLLEAVREILPDFTPEDMVGSAYATRAYRVDASLGGESELAHLRERLARHGLKLMLDFVPNHTGLDHDWTVIHPDYYIQGTTQDAEAHPAWYHNVNGREIAKGRDPHFDPWPDVAQLNAFSPGYREASIDTLRYIASNSDGVRCDMAMLMTNEVFARTWGKQAGEVPASEYWQDVILAVREAAPDFVFMAECYWNMQGTLIEQGFDYCYDKDLYDLIVAKNMPEATAHAKRAGDLAPHLVHFLENHDEPRAASLLTANEQRAATRLITSLPGPRLWHDGQFEGFRAKLPVHIGRGPDETIDETVAQVYRDELAKP